MSWSKGFNFRGSSGFVTDGADCSPVIVDVYPTTFSNGAVGGWSTAVFVDGVDRNNAIDVRLAGMNYMSNGLGRTFRVDLPAIGDYLLTLAVGDAAAPLSSVTLVKDTATTKLTLTGTDTGVSGFYDATGTYYAVAAWPGSQTPATVTFATTILNIVASNDVNWRIAHLFVSQVAASGSLHRSGSLNGLGAHGPFFHDPLA